MFIHIVIKLITAFLIDWSSRTGLRSKTRNKQIQIKANLKIWTRSYTQDLVGCLQDYWETKEINPRGVRDRMRSKMTKEVTKDRSQ